MPSGPRSREINIVSISALDLLASGLGAFVLFSLVFVVFFTMMAKTAAPEAPDPVTQCPGAHATGSGVPGTDAGTSDEASTYPAAGHRDLHGRHRQHGGPDSRSEAGSTTWR